MKCKEAYADWTTFAGILRDALDHGVPATHYAVVTDALEAVETELTRFEAAQLTQSEARYAVLTEKLNESKADLERIKDENDKIIQGAERAAQAIAILTSLLPMLA